MSPAKQPPTPYLRIDVPRMRRNIQRLADYCREHNLRAAPHTKTHKSIRVANAQIEAGAAALTVAKVGEAEVMAQAIPPGSDTALLVAYPVLNPQRAATLAEIARDRTVRVALDSTRAADALGDAARRAGVTIGVLPDIDVGMHRTGVQSPETLLELAQYVERVNGLRVDGIFTYYGHVIGTEQERAEQLRPISDRLAEAVGLFTKAGLDTGIVTAGSTPTMWQSHLVEPVTEIRPGTSVYFDVNCVRQNVCTIDDCAARIVATVVSDAVPDQVVLDAGSKTLTSDKSPRHPELGHGYIIEYPEATITKLSEEHGQVDVSQCPRKPEVGEQVTIIPNHVCVAVNMQDRAWWNESNDGEVALEPLPIDARGRIW